MNKYVKPALLIHELDMKDIVRTSSETTGYNSYTTTTNELCQLFPQLPGCNP